MVWDGWNVEGPVVAPGLMSALTVVDAVAAVDEAAVRLVDSVAIRLDEVTKVFGSGDSRLLAVDRLSMEVNRGELVCLLGASGCGKSTVLNLVAGLETPTRGTVSVPAGNTTLMFQEAALFPWLTVEQNVGMPMRLRGRRRSERSGGVRELLELVRLETDVTILFVTHSVREATRLGDRIVVLSSRPGRVLEEFTIPGDGSPAGHELAAAPLVPRITEVLRHEIGRHGRG